MRTLVLLSSLAVASAGGCRHATRVGDTYTATAAGGPVAVEERASPAAPEGGENPPGDPVPGATAAGAGGVPGAACPPGVTCGPGVTSPPNSFLTRCGQWLGQKEPCRRPEIHVTVPPPKVVIRREEKPAVRTPPPAAPRPGNEVMLVPTTVYVPYARMTPTAPVTMASLNAVPAPEPPAAAPCAPPPGAAPCPPGASGWGPQSPPGGPSETQTIDALNRRCSALENKIDALVEALKARPNR